MPGSWLMPLPMILKFSLNKHLLSTTSAHCALAIQVLRVSVDESQFTGWDYKVKECVLRTRTILSVISSINKNKSTHKITNVNSGPAVLWCLGSAKDREEGISQVPALISSSCSKSVPRKNLNWRRMTNRKHAPVLCMLELDSVAHWSLAKIPACSPCEDGRTPMVGVLLPWPPMTMNQQEA